MSSPMHVQESERIMKKRIQENPAWEVILLKTLRRMETGYWSDQYVNSIGQKHHKGITLLDAWAFLEVHADLHTGKLALLYIPLGETPYPDRAVTQNQSCLDGLPLPFSAQFIPQSGGSADDDGVFKWSRPIRMIQHPLSPDRRACIAKPRTVPLEVGTTEFTKTLLHARTTGVARWPYDSDNITLLYRCIPPAVSVPFVAAIRDAHRTPTTQLSFDLKDFAT